MSCDRQILDATNGCDGIEVVDVSNYVSLTEIAKLKCSRASTPIKYWIRTRKTLALLAAWEEANNPCFDKSAFYSIFDNLDNLYKAMTVSRWTKVTNAIGIFSKAGKGGGTWADKSIAADFLFHVFPSYKAEEMCLVLNDFNTFKSRQENTFKQISSTYADTHLAKGVRNE